MGSRTSFVRVRVVLLAVGASLACGVFVVPLGVAAAAGRAVAAKSSPKKASAALTSKQVAALVAKDVARAIAKLRLHDGAAGPAGQTGARGQTGGQGPSGPAGSLTGVAGGALTGSYPNPTLSVTGGPCATGQLLANLSPAGGLTCGAGAGGTDNSALGSGALAANTGVSNTAVGEGALTDNGPGSDNVAVGTSALHIASNPVDDLAIGMGAGGALTGNDDSDIDIGSSGASTDNNTIRIGTPGSALGDQNQAYVAGVYGTAATGTLQPVVVNSSGQLGALTSSNGFASNSVPNNLPSSDNYVIDLGTHTVVVPSGGGRLFAQASLGLAETGTQNARIECILQASQNGGAFQTLGSGGYDDDLPGSSVETLTPLGEAQEPSGTYQVRVDCSPVRGDGDEYQSGDLQVEVLPG